MKMDKKFSAAGDPPPLEPTMGSAPCTLVIGSAQYGLPPMANPGSATYPLPT